MTDTALPKKPRMFLVDHMCVLPYGHNLNCLLLFEDALKSRFASTVCLACRSLPAYAEQSVKVKKILRFPYDGLIETAPGRKPRQRDPIKTTGLDWSALGRTFVRNGRRAGYTMLLRWAGYDYVRRRTQRDWQHLFKRLRIGADDMIFFPSAEHYGCLSLLDLLHGIPASSRPSVHLRLIGVMESATYAAASGRPAFFAGIRKALSNGINLTISAETTTYAEFVQRVIGAPVTYLPYPLANQQEPLGWQDVKVVASPGQGRRDKGFFKIFNIIKRLYDADSGASFVFDVQNMRRSDREFRPRYESILKNTPNVKLRPARLSQQEIDAVYVASDILLLPYDPEVYALRGSAVYQEGLATGRPVICSTGTGISELVLRYGNGLLAMSDNEFAERIRELAAKPRHEVEAMTTAAREAYQKDFENGLAQIFGGHVQ